ncbi:hypothetical protein [Paenibacillus paeoniae]|uniref:DUF2357 domain-containing protein n=1 Tax=Paenibacillus paeoniae TaxID=2292705 RepID=A0A371PJI6_9BACL|nr:hypothetical protein [Paenibacillus paeoniae]REK76095.1 hypothetical protein DX130_03240 [Paenibacillus paeoniae]
MTTPPKIFVAVQKHKLGEWLPEQELPLHVKGEFKGEPFQVKEYEGLRFRFVSDDSDDRMVVEKFDLEIMEQFGPGESIVLTRPGDSDDMLVPGDYAVAVRTKRTSYEAFYRIEPKNMGWGQLLNLRNYLEQKLTGLSSDLLKRRSGTSEDDLEQMPSALKVYQHVQKNFNQLRHHLDSIVEDSIRDVVQIYGIRNYSRKPDAKSQRWLSKRGSAKNATFMTPIFFNEKHTY